LRLVRDIAIEALNTSRQSEIDFVNKSFNSINSTASLT
jgi:hypothetical protein